MTRTRWTVVVGALVLVAVVVAVSVAVVLTRASTQSSAARPPSGLDPALEQFVDQDLRWGPCAPFAGTVADEAVFAEARYDCTHLEVPLDYANPGGTTARIALLRQRALDQSRRIGSLFTDPGGPGGSGTSFLPTLSQLIGTGEVAQRFDLIGFDPRGVGASEPVIDCSTDAEIDAERADNDVDPSPAGVEQTEAEHREFAQRCVDRVGLDVLANIGTRDVARDLRIAHLAVGDPQLSYVGYSYGTAIGTEYAEQFPGDVRALVLDGAIDPALDPVASRVTQSRGFQRAFDNFAAFCAQQPDCPLGDDPAQATGELQDLFRPLIDQPVLASPEGRVLGWNDAQTGLSQALYTEAYWPALQEGLLELRSGTGSILLQLADQYFKRSPQGVYSDMLEGFQVITCADEVPLTDRAVAREISEQALELAPFSDPGTGPSDALDLCSFWPVPPTSEPGPATAPGLPQVLVVSSSGDPATPYEDGVSLAQQLGATLLSVENDTHTVALQGLNPCADELATRYLVDLALPAGEASC